MYDTSTQRWYNLSKTATTTRTTRTGKIAPRTITKIEKITTRTKTTNVDNVEVMDRWVTPPCPHNILENHLTVIFRKEMLI